MDFKCTGEYNILREGTLKGLIAKVSALIVLPRYPATTNKSL